MKIDKSLFTPEELAQYQALIAKAKVDPEAAEEEMEGEKPAFPAKKPAVPPMEEDDDMEEDMEKGKCKKGKCKKSASPELTAALERLETLEKSIDMKEFTEIAKKYAPLGEKEEDLAKTLYDMKKSSPENYDAYIKVLDKSLGLVEKSGVFAEIGKSAGGSHVSGGAEAKAEAKAGEIMKADPSIGYAEAIAKAWEDPALMAEYDAEYRR